MIKLLYAKDVEPEWFNGRVFDGTNETVQNVISDVVQNGDAALKKYGEKFDVSAPEKFLIPEAELKNAAEKLKTEHPDIYNSVCYSHELAYKFALRQKKSFDDFEEEIAPGMFTGQKTIPVERAGVYVPAGRFPLSIVHVIGVLPVAASFWL